MLINSELLFLVDKSREDEKNSDTVTVDSAKMMQYSILSFCVCGSILGIIMPKIRNVTQCERISAIKFIVNSSFC